MLIMQESFNAWLYVFSAVAVIVVLIGFYKMLSGGLDLLGGGIDLAAGLVKVANETPLKYEPLPEPPRPLTNQPWRQRTSVRYLERLKQELIEGETELTRLYQEMEKQFPTSGQESAGILRHASYAHNLAAFNESKKEVASLINRIESIVEGNVRSEIDDIEVKVEKLKRERVEYEGELGDVAKRAVREGTIEEREALEEKRNGLRRDIKNVDMSLIELEGAMKELRRLDFEKLYKELDVSPEVARVDTEHLSSIKDKKEIIAVIKPPEPRVESKLTADEERVLEHAKYETELERLRRAKKKAMDAVDPEDEDLRVQLANMYDDRIAEALERLRKVL